VLKRINAFERVGKIMNELERALKSEEFMTVEFPTFRPDS
jgi:hypothetical protein